MQWNFKLKKGTLLNEVLEIPAGRANEIKAIAEKALTDGTFIGIIMAFDRMNLMDQEWMLAMYLTGYCRCSKVIREQEVAH